MEYIYGFGVLRAQTYRASGTAPQTQCLMPLANNPGSTPVLLYPNCMGTVVLLSAMSHS